MSQTDWIAVDWGTSTLRAWAMRGAEMRATARSDQGMAALAGGDFEAALLALIDPWLEGPTTVVACGMVGARQGWIEAPYSKAPCAARASRLMKAPSSDPRLSVWIAPGVSQASPADVMRGEETQIAGYLAGDPEFDGVLCLPGTHTKWAQISAGEIVSFRTYMTGELYKLLSTQSVLRHSIAAGWDAAGFDAAVSETLSDPGRLAAQLFGIRAVGLLSDQDGDAAGARLSGLLIGAELAGARPYWLGQDVVVIGAPELTAAYATALQAQGLTVRQADGGAMTRAGLTALYEQEVSHATLDCHPTWH